MAVGDRRQPLETGIAMQLERPLTELSCGAAGQGVVQRIDFSQQADVGIGVAPGKRRSGTGASITDAPGSEKLRDAARDLGARLACCFRQIPPQHAPIRAGGVGIAEALEGVGHPGVGGGTRCGDLAQCVSKGEGYRLGARHEGAHLFQGLHGLRL